MEKIKNLSLRKTIVLYMIVSLIVSFYLSALIMRMAATIQDDIWWKYVDQEKYFERELLTLAKYMANRVKSDSITVWSLACRITTVLPHMLIMIVLPLTAQS